MSIYVDESECDFHIKMENIPAAFEAAKQLVRDGKYMAHCDEVWRKSVLQAASLDDLLEKANGWETEVEDYDITNISSSMNFRDED